MGKKQINLNVDKKSRSYVDCLYSVLSSLGLFHGDLHMLSGMSGFAFKFIVHKKLYPSAVDMYNMSWETWTAADRLGIYSETYAGFKNQATFRLYQKAAVRKIKESLDDGRAVIMAYTDKMQYAVIYGYDDSDGVFYIKESGNTDFSVILYENFGICRGACWFYQLFGDKIDLDRKQIYIRSLINAVDEWETLYKLDPETNKEYASGLKGYDYLINAFKSRDFDLRGARFTIHAYAKSKMEIYLYMNEVIRELRGMERTLEQYRQISENYKEAVNSLTQYGEIGLNEKICDRLVKIFESCRELEQIAIDHIKEYLIEILNNRFVDTYETEQFAEKME